MHVVNMAGSTGPVVFANNLFHGNTAAGQQELRYMSPSGPSYVTLRNNAMTMPLNGVPQSETGTIAPTASMFDPITLVPTRNSLLVNNATTNVTGGLGTVDFLNHPRNSNGAPDIGAIEADAEYLLVNGFE